MVQKSSAFASIYLLASMYCNLFFWGGNSYLFLLK